MRLVNKQSGNYKIEEKLEAGIVLIGSEVKAARLGHADITGSYVKIIGLEAYLVGAKIFPYEFSRVENYDEKRTRKLLLHKREILALKSRLETGNYTLVPLSLYLKNGNFKLEVALSKGQKAFERRKDSKRRVLERVQERELKYIRS